MIATAKTFVLLAGSATAALMAAHVLMCLAIVAFSVSVLIALEEKWGTK